MYFCLIVALFVLKTRLTTQYGRIYGSFHGTGRLFDCWHGIGRTTAVKPAMVVVSSCSEFCASESKTRDLLSPVFPVCRNMPVISADFGNMLFSIRVIREENLIVV